MTIRTGGNIIAGSFTEELLQTKANLNLDNSTAITNCITNIPQDIKLELNNGTLTLKAGSKVYVPNGFEADGTTPKFDELVLSSDLSPALSTAKSQTCLLYVRNDGSTFDFRLTSLCSSGSSDPGTNATHYYNITTNKLICHFGGGGTAEDSFPIALFTTNSSGVVSSIDQVFNGFGYIGSTVFALPGVKGLSPNYRNTDGTLKNSNVSIGSVVTHTQTSGTVTLNISIGNTYINPTGATYDSVRNINVFSNGNDTMNRCLCGTVSYNNGVVKTFNIKTVFHALDYNDSSTISGWSMPSSKYIDLTLGASHSNYTAPANGWVFFAKASGSSGQFNSITNSTGGGLRSDCGAANSNQWATVNCPVKKGDIFSIEYTTSGETKIFRFIYAEGEGEN